MTSGLGKLTLLFTLLTVTQARSQQTSPVEVRQQTYLGLDQMLSIMERSKVAYTIQPLSQLGRADPRRLAAATYPQRERRVRSPWKSKPGQAQTLVPYPVVTNAARLLKKADLAMAKGRTSLARQSLTKALEIQPGCPPASALLGKLLLNEGQPEKALAAIDRAIGKNPFDPELRRLKGHASADLNRWDQAREAYIQALVLAPRDPETLDALDRHQRDLHVRVNRNLLRHRSLARKEGRIISIYVDSTDANSRIWMAYAAAKALWMGEAHIRKNHGGGAGTDWSTQEEAFCLNALLGHYLAGREKNLVGPMSDLEVLKTILGHDLSLEFVLYEIASRMDPNITIKLDETSREKLEAFVRGFIVVLAGSTRD